MRRDFFIVLSFGTGGIFVASPSCTFGSLFIFSFNAKNRGYKSFFKELILYPAQPLPKNRDSLISALNHRHKSKVNVRL